MPGFRPRRDPLLRLASSSSRKAAVSTGSVGVSGVRGRADMSGGAGGANTMVGELHMIDTFSVVDDATDEFTMSYPPLLDSWNLELNGSRVHADEFTISDRTITILDPADLFLGADTQGSPWSLEIQYDYLFGVTASVVGSGLVSAGAALTGTLNLDIPGGTQIGDLMMAHFATTNTFFVAVVPSGWSLVETRGQDGGGGLASHIFMKVADGADIGDTVTWTASAGNLCGGMVTFPGGSSFTLDANQAVGTDVDHPAVTIPAGGCAWYVLGVGHDFSGGSTLGAATGTALWANDATFQASASAQQLTAGAQPAIESNFSVAASLIAYSIVVT